MHAEGQRYLAPAAWVGGSWKSDVVLAVATDGTWSEVVPDAPAAMRRDAQALRGPVLPGLVNGHSHAFQRAIAGLAERSGGSEDGFWHWRDRMYGAANRITSRQLEAIAAFLYSELLRSGYTHVCEFHYLHQDPEGRACADPLELPLALVRAARRAGIGLTLLPALYMRSGFAASRLREDQRRFASTPQSVLHIAHEVAKLGGEVAAGVALHSLRAVDEPALRELVAAVGPRMPVHIHVAEQRREVDDCVARHGLRPVEWLLQQVALDARWNLVHATQCTRFELEAVRNSGASIVLCPSTEANLGDGIFDLPGWMGLSGRWSIGSDSHVTRSWPEELRLLEYSQRLGLRQRNVAGRAALSESCAAALFEGALEGGSAAAGLALGGLAPGQRADFVVLDTASDALAGMPPDHLLDALVFSSPLAAFSEVFVAGRAVPPADPALRADFAGAMAELGT
jgi:formimidoylglutamate deiminase